MPDPRAEDRVWERYFSKEELQILQQLLENELETIRDGLGKKGMPEYQKILTDLIDEVSEVLFRKEQSK